MEIEFELTRDDYLQFVRHAAAHDPHILTLRRQARRRTLWTALGGAVVLSVLAYLSVPPHRPGDVIAIIAGVLVAAVMGGGLYLVLFGGFILVRAALMAAGGGYPGRVRLQRRGIERGDLDPELGTFLMQANPDGLVMTGPRSSTTDLWGSIRLVETEWAFLLYRSPNTAHVIPKRALAGDSQITPMRRAFQGWIRSARALAPPTKPQETVLSGRDR